MSKPYEPYHQLEAEEERAVDDSLAAISRSQSLKIKSKKRKIAGLILGICCVVSAAAAAVIVRHKTPRSHNQKISALATSKQLTSASTSKQVSTASTSDLSCTGDKLFNEVPLERGQYICSDNGKYAVGFDDSGDFVWLNVAKGEELPYYDHNNAIEAANPAFFLLEEDGTMVLSESNDKIVWEKKPILDVTFSDRCLHLMYPCPFLQIHNDGVLVLRWQDKEDNWLEHNLYKVYGEGEEDGTATDKPHPSMPKEDKDADEGVALTDPTNRKHMDAAFQCVGERLSNEIMLHAGEYLCSANNQYVVGLTSKGHVMWMDLAGEETLTYFNKTESSKEAFHFYLNSKGSFVVADAFDKDIWVKKPLPDHNITYTENCLDPFNCPYLHLHNDGVLVVNWMTKHGIVDHDVRKVYGFSQNNQVE